MRIMTAVLLISMGLRIQENLLYFPFSLAHWVWYLRWKRLIYLPSVKSDKRMRSLSNFAGCAKLIETDPGRITAKRGILFNLCVIIKETYVYFALSSSRQCKSNGKHWRGANTCATHSFIVPARTKQSCLTFHSCLKRHLQQIRAVNIAENKHVVTPLYIYKKYYIQVRFC